MMAGTGSRRAGGRQGRGCSALAFGRRQLAWVRLPGSLGETCLAADGPVSARPLRMNGRPLSRSGRTAVSVRTWVFVTEG